ncbi:hypothetical protein FQN54_005225 [Arachnomyces sp. PD_36]|nr:hypothetical protein FQN54_005225 [Arachnomyces sp. PD_36]
MSSQSVPKNTAKASVPIPVKGAASAPLMKPKPNSLGPPVPPASKGFVSTLTQHTAAGKEAVDVKSDERVAHGQPEGPKPNTGYYCPYHTPILEGLSTQDHNQGQQLPWNQSMTLDPGNQSALLVRPDNGQLSLSRNCTCVDAEEAAVLDI